jgi:uncharacterized protein YraI
VSHARRGCFAAALIGLAAAQAAAEPAVVTAKLNVRSGPGPAFGIIAVMPPGTRLDTQKCADEWCRVKVGPQVGYVNRDYLKLGADSYASAAPTAPAAPQEPKPALNGPRIWQWHDSAWRDEHWRRLDWHNRMKH